MGKTAGGAVWLDPDKTSPYDFYQYWRNVDDADVMNFLRKMTFLPLEQIDEMAQWEGSQLNEAKEILATELTTLVHGQDEAEKAKKAAKSLFAGGASSDDVPTTEMDADRFEGEGMGLVSLLKEIGLVSSNSEGFRTIEQGGLTVNDEKITDKKLSVTADLFKDGALLIRKGKKKFHKVVIR